MHRSEAKVIAGVVLMFAALLFSIWRAQSAVSDVKSEIKTRRSQTCTTFETAHLEEVRKLESTYKFLLQVKPAEKRTTLYRFVVASLPELERNAQKDYDQYGVVVPAYCDKPGIGLPEPDPKIPSRPAQLKNLPLTPG